MPKVEYTHAKGLVQSTGSGFCLGTPAATVTAAASAAALTASAVILKVDSADDAHEVKMPLATSAGQIIIVTNVDSAQDVVIKNNADDATLATVGEGVGAILVSTATGDNWVPVGLGS